MGEVDALLSEAAKRNIKLWVEGDNLRFQCAPAAMSEDFRITLKSKRNEIIDTLLARRSSQAFGSTTPKFAVTSHEDVVPIIAYHKSRWNYMKSDFADFKFNNGTHSVFVVQEQIDIGMLQESVDYLTSRHAILKARVVDREGGPVFVFDRSSSIKVEYSDVSNTASDNKAALACDIASRAVWRPFGSGDEPWFRVFAVKQDENEYVVGFVIHHFVADGVSVGIVRYELAIAYASLMKGHVPPLPSLPLQYSDYVNSINDWLQYGDAEPHALYWRRVLANSPPTLLPPDADLGPEERGYEASHEFDLPADVVVKLREQTKNNNIAMLSTVLAVLVLSLALISKSRDIVVQTRVTGRVDPRLLGMVGALFDTIALRVDVDESATFAAFIDYIRKVFVEGSAHQSYSYHLVKSLLPEIGASDISPLLNFLNTYVEQSGHSGIEQGLRRFKLHPPPRTLHVAGSHSSFYMRVVHDFSGLHVTVDYLSLRYKEETIRRFAEVFCRAFELMMDGPNERISSILTAEI